MNYLKGFLVAFIVSFTCVAVPVSAETGSSSNTDTTAQTVSSGNVNINTDSSNALALGLKGIGVKRAQAIVAYREANGPFEDVSQLQEIKGIGEAIIEQNLDKIRL